MTTETAILWFRRDLRLNDHPALAAACVGHARVYASRDHAPYGRARDAPVAAALAAALALDGVTSVLHRLSTTVAITGISSDGRR